MICAAISLNCSLARLTIARSTICEIDACSEASSSTACPRSHPRLSVTIRAGGSVVAFTVGKGPNVWVCEGCT